MAEINNIQWEKPVTKGMLKAFGDKSKGLFLYPKSTTGANNSWIISDINLGLNFRELYLRVLCISKEENVFAPVDSIIGLVSDENAITFASCVNEGKHTIESIRFYIDESILKIAAKLKGTTDSCSVSAQVIGASSKEEIIKEVILAGSCNPQDYWQIGDSTDYNHLIDGEIYNNSDSTVSFTIKNGSDNPSYPETAEFDTIKKAKLLSHQLKFNYDFTQSQGDGDEDILVGNLSDHIYIPIPELSLSDLAPKEEGTYVIKVTKDELENTTSSFSLFPTANINTVGGISIYSNNDELSEGNYPVKLDNENKAYVNLSDITNELNELSTSVSNIDVHRFSDLDHVPEEVKKPGMIVLYIGENNNTYNNGYFYQFIPTDFAVSKTDTKWVFDPTDDSGEAIAQYNATLNYLITFGNLEISILPAVEQTTISDDTRFVISQNGSDLAELTYAELKQNFKIKRHQDSLSDLDANFVLTLGEVEGAFEWRLKNVLPTLKVDNPLVFKGTITVEEGETDIQALNRAILEKEIGHFYIVKPSSQEYFWNGTEWEFVGDIFNPYSSGTGIEINNNQINCTVLGNIKPDWNAESGADNEILNKPTIPTVNNNKLSIQGEGVEAIEFTANSSADKTLNIKGTGLIDVEKTADGEITISTTATDNTGTITKVGNTTTGEVSVSSSNNTANFGQEVTVGTVGGVDLKFTMPNNPNTDTDTNTATLQVIDNDGSNEHYLTTSESPNDRITFTGGTNGFTITDSRGELIEVDLDILAGTSTTVTLNGVETTNPSFYAPTTSGDTGKYLKSNGEGAPEWSDFPKASANTLGGVKLLNDTTITQGEKTYYVQLTEGGVAAVNVPWTTNQSTLYLGTISGSDPLINNPHKGDYYLVSDTWTYNGQSYQPGTQVVYNGVTWDIVSTNIAPATSNPYNISSTTAIGNSVKYAREDHQHAISVLTGDSNGQVKIAGQNATVKGLKSAAYKDVPSSGNASKTQVVLGNDTRLSDARNAVDVYDWAKAATKPTYTKSDVGLGNVGNFKAVSTEANLGLTSTEQSNARSNIGAGTSSLTLGDTSTTAAYGNHTHNTTLATDSGTSTVDLVANTTYKLTAGDTSIIFKTPADVDISGKQDSSTAITHTASTAVGSATNPVYVASNGAATACTYNLNATVPSTAVFTDRYVNTASFADDSSNNSANPVKMTLTRAGSDSLTVTANIPKVSSTTSGVAPKGNTVSTLSLSTKFLREDGTWAAPSYTANTNTTYTFAEGSTNGAFQVTPSGGDAQSVAVHGVLTSHQTIKLDGITGATIKRYVTCITAANTAEKTVNILNGAFSLESGAKVTVKFSNSNLNSSPTLNVNSTGAKSIYCDGAAIDSNSLNLISGICDFIYDGTNWNLINKFNKVEKVLTETTPSSVGIINKGYQLLFDSKVFNNAIKYDSSNVGKVAESTKLYFDPGPNSNSSGTLYTDRLNVSNGIIARSDLGCDIGDDAGGAFNEIHAATLHLASKDNDEVSGHTRQKGGKITFGDATDDCYIEEGPDDDLTISTYGHMYLNTTEESSSIYLLPKNGVVIISGRVLASGGFYESSDIKKKNILEEISIDKAYELIDKCQTIFFTFKDDEEKKQLLGVIAQEIEQYFPELVSKDSEGFLSVDYSKLSVILMRVIKDMKSKMSDFEERLLKLERKYESD